MKYIKIILGTLVVSTLACITSVFATTKNYNITLKELNATTTVGPQTKQTTVRQAYENKETIKVEIIDTGKGIKKEDIPFIWDKYYKNKKEHKRNKIGTGLGLSIVKNILTIHNYEFGVNSKKDKGSNFYFIIKKEL